MAIYPLLPCTNGVLMEFLMYQGLAGLFEKSQKAPKPPISNFPRAVFLWQSKGRYHNDGYHTGSLCTQNSHIIMGLRAPFLFWCGYYIIDKIALQGLVSEFLPRKFQFLMQSRNQQIEIQSLIKLIFRIYGICYIICRLYNIRIPGI